MPTNKQRREAERRRLQRQLEQRRIREGRRKQGTLIASIAGTLVVIAAIVILVLVNSGKSSPGQPAAGSTASPTASPTTSPSTGPSTAAALAAPTACAKLKAKNGSVTFDGVTLGKATDLKHEPKITSASTVDPNALECADVVVGTGKAATPASTVNVEYAGVLYKNGTAFDSSWSRGGKPVSFPLTGVVPGFTQGIGGTGKVTPMRVGGRRIMILPPSLGYGAQANGSIPANSTLVFIVDLTSAS